MWPGRPEPGWSASPAGRGVGVWESALCPHGPGCPVSPEAVLGEGEPALRGGPAIQGLSRFFRTSEPQPKDESRTEVK